MSPMEQEHRYESLIEGYEKGSLTRRDLIRSLLALGAASAMSACDNGPTIREDEILGEEDVDLGVDLDPDRTCDGRKVLLERIMNQTFAYPKAASSDPLEQKEIEYNHETMFSSSVEHQEWLFGALGLKGYQAQGNTAAVSDDVKNNNGITIHAGCGIANATARQNVQAAKNACNGQIDVFQRGVAQETICYDDLYGLVKAKLNYACGHSAQGGALVALGVLKAVDADAGHVARLLQDDTVWRSFQNESNRVAALAGIDWDDIRDILDDFEPPELPDVPGIPDTLHGSY